MSIRTRIVLNKIANHFDAMYNPLHKQADWLDSAASFVKNAPGKVMDWAGRQLADTDAAQYRQQNNMNKMMRDRLARDAGKPVERWDGTVARSNEYADTGSGLKRIYMRAKDKETGLGDAQTADTAQRAIAGTAKREGAMNQRIRELEAQLQQRTPQQVSAPQQAAPKPATPAPSATPTPAPAAPAKPVTPAAPAAPAPTPAPKPSPVTTAATTAVNTAAQGVGDTYDKAVDTVGNAVQGVGDVAQTAASIPGNVVGSTLSAIGLPGAGQVQRAVNVPGQVVGNTVRGVGRFGSRLAKGDFKKAFVGAGNEIANDIGGLFRGWGR